MRAPDGVFLEPLLDGDGDEASWAALLSDPAAEDKWWSVMHRREARRSRVERLSDHAWLADLWLRLRSLSRRGRLGGPAMSIEADALFALLDARRGRRRSVGWGEFVEVFEDEGARLAVDCGGGAVWWRTFVEAGRLGDSRWVVRAEDGPAVLIAVDSAADDTLDAALANASALAVAVIWPATRESDGV